MKRIALALVVALISITTPAVAATFGEVFDLNTKADNAQKEVCPPRIETRSGDDLSALTGNMKRLGCLAKLETVKMLTLQITMHTAKVGMDKCLSDLQTKHDKSSCDKIDNDHYKALPIPAALEPTFKDAKDKFDAAVREYRR